MKRAGWQTGIARLPGVDRGAVAAIIAPWRRGDDPVVRAAPIGHFSSTVPRTSERTHQRGPAHDPGALCFLTNPAPSPGTRRALEPLTPESRPCEEHCHRFRRNRVSGPTRCSAGLMRSIIGVLAENQTCGTSKYSLSARPPLASPAALPHGDFACPRRGERRRAAHCLHRK